ncbi:MAG: metal ABC transporter substrate-binding protein [Synechococcales cyanobacterium M58_A2018_015]|nr:metal ABC transporter substrate-binding protein [Synechococcales cyanobacterium M58_A2018_015]
MMVSHWRSSLHKLHKLGYQLGLGFLALGLSSCALSNPGAVSSGSGADDKPQVVSTSTIISDWTQQIGGDEIHLTSILKPGDDPHVYEPVPQDSRALETADLILYNGYNLEPGLLRMIEAAGTNAQKLAVAETVPPLQLEQAGQSVPDPHVWGSAKNAVVMVNAIRDALIEVSPEDQALFTENADRLEAELQQLDTWIGRQIATIPANQRQLVTTHDAFQYYANAYGLTVAGTLIGISTEEQPSAQTVQKLVDDIKSIGIPTIFAETTINPQLITTVAQEAGVKLAPQKLYSDSLGAPGSDGETYTQMMVANTRTIVENLGGQFQPFRAE